MIDLIYFEQSGKYYVLDEKNLTRLHFAIFMHILVRKITFQEFWNKISGKLLLNFFLVSHVILYFDPIDTLIVLYYVQKHSQQGSICNKNY